MNLSDIFIKSYNLSKTTQYRFECKRKSLFSLPENKIANLDFYQLAFIEGSTKYPFLNDLLVMFRLRNRLIIEVLVPIEEDNNSNDIWTPNKKFFESIIYPLENDASNKVVCSKYLLIDFRSLGRIKIDDTEDIYKRSRLEWDEALNNIMQWSDTLKKEALKELSAIGIPHRHWFQEIWLSYQNEADRTCCVRIW